MSIIRYIVECIKPFKDGNTYPQEARPGQRFDVSETEYARLKQSGPFCWELIDRVIPNPYKKDEEEVEEYTPIGWYAAQLARE